MVSNVPQRHAIRNPLKTQDLHQPIKQNRGVMILDRPNDSSLTEVFANIIDVRWRPSEAADRMNQFDSISRIWIGLEMGFGDVFHEKWSLESAANRRSVINPV